MPTLNFNWTRLAGLPDDGVVTDVVAAPVTGGPGAVVTFKQSNCLRCGWLYHNSNAPIFKLLDDDLYRNDQFKDDSGYVWLAMDKKLYAIASHAFDGVGASSRLTVGIADAPWANLAYSTLNNHIDERVYAILKSLALLT